MCNNVNHPKALNVRVQPHRCCACLTCACGWQCAKMALIPLLIFSIPGVLNVFNFASLGWAPYAPTFGFVAAVLGIIGPSLLKHNRFELALNWVLSRRPGTTRTTHTLSPFGTTSTDL